MLKLEVITPMGNILSVNATQVTVPGSLGEFQILPHHLPALVILGGGRLSYRGENAEGGLFLRGGVIEINKEGHVLVLTDETQTTDQLNRARAQKIKEEAQERFKSEAYLTDARLDQLHASDDLHDIII